MDKAMISKIGKVVTIAAIGISLLSNWISEKEMEEKIEEKVNEALSKRNQE